MKAVRLASGYDDGGFPILPADIMLKWAFALFLAVVLIGLLRPGTASRLRLGRLPGDLHFRFRGREYLFPFTSTLLLSLLATLVFRLL